MAIELVELFFDLFWDLKSKPRLPIHNLVEYLLDLRNEEVDLRQMSIFRPHLRYWYPVVAIDLQL